MLFLYEQPQAAEWQTISTTQVGPGVFHKHIIAPKVPWNINVLQIDLSNPLCHIETVKADDALRGYESVSSMSERRNWNGHFVTGAINADFFGDGGVPVNAQICDGRLLKTPIEYSTIGFDIYDRPQISRISFSGVLIARGAQHPINGINQDRNTDQLILYNSYFGPNTGTNQWGTEVLIAPLSGWLVNDTLSYVALQKDTTGSMAIADGEAVLSGHGSAGDFLNNHIQVGDTVRLGLLLQPDLAKLKELTGGFPKIVKDGKNYALKGYDEEGGHSSFATDYHPRTAAGYSADGKTLFFVTVDGRQEGLSRGMSLPELADFMITQGVYTALNLDGGGSTAMVVRGQIKNSPSDGHERSVSNALLAVSTARQGNLSHIQMEPDNERLFLGDKISFTASGWDDEYNPVSISSENVTFEVDSALGIVDDQGHFTATKNGGDGYVYARYYNLTDSAHIHIKAVININMTPQVVVADTLQPLLFSVSVLDEDSSRQTLPSDSYLWQSTDEDVGVIDSLGRFYGHNEGTTQIIVHYAELSDTASVQVEIGNGIVLLDSMDSLRKWHIGGENIDTLKTTLSVVDTPRTFGAKALRIDYSFKRLATERSTVHLNTDIPVYGVPEFIDFDFKSDGRKHKTYVIVSDDNNEYFKANIRGYANQAGKYDTITALTSSFRAMEGGQFHFPIRIKSIWIKLGYSSAVNEVNEGTLYIDNLRVVYPEVTTIFPLAVKTVPSRLQLNQNYPNPFNPRTTIEFFTPKSGKVRLDIFDVLGRKVSTLFNRKLSAGRHRTKWDGSGFASGIYYCRLRLGPITRVSKMLLIK